MSIISERFYLVASTNPSLSFETQRFSSLHNVLYTLQKWSHLKTDARIKALSNNISKNMLADNLSS